MHKITLPIKKVWFTRKPLTDNKISKWQMHAQGKIALKKCITINQERQMNRKTKIKKAGERESEKDKERERKEA